MNSREHESSISPLTKTIMVHCSVEAAFRIFTDGLSAWWPLGTHSVGLDSAETCAFEGRVGGKVYERLDDGRELAWGEVLQWDPPNHLAFTWHPGREPDTAQTVDVSFTPTDQGTRVDLTHSGWERLGERARPSRQNYDSGWDLVFVERYGGRCAVEIAVGESTG